MSSVAALQIAEGAGAFRDGTSRRAGASADRMKRYLTDIASEAKRKRGADTTR